MRIITFFLVFAYSLGENMHPQISNQCIVNTDLHVMLTKLNCALVQTREKMKFFEGRVDYNEYNLN